MSALAASAKGASILILLQVATRALTFVVNQVLLRYVSPELLGLEAQLALYTITTLYFSRESIRVAVQRRPYHTPVVVNMSYISIILGLPLTFILARLYLQADVPDTPYFKQSLVIYAISCIAQLLTEPAFVVAQQKLRFGIRASSEGLATVLRCLVTCGAAMWASSSGNDIGILPFALGELAYGSIRLLAYTVQVWPISAQDNVSLLPRRLQASNDEKYIWGYFSKSLSKLTLSLWIQDTFKYVLTQGDSILIATLASLQDQGAYALASNYGGLIARMLFQPIEESSRNLIANVCSPDPATKKPTNTGLGEAKRLLRTILKLYLLIGLVAVAIGPSIAPLLLRLVAGARWIDTGAGKVLSVYCYYIPFLAINGLTEAFVAAVASNSQLGSQSFSMGFFFVAFASTAWLSLQKFELGASGLVYANCVNMGLRILFNTHFISKYFLQHGQPFSFSDTLPSMISTTTGVLFAAIFSAIHPRLITMNLLRSLLLTGSLSIAFGIVLTAMKSSEEGALDLVQQAVLIR
ncbi:uncharacterized protein PV09_03582 [Verruconis gallopava]|uniref:Man(5)GlcNAc(2)-PP-dolichol translocation protein RFT1 n=1 Tax=Verruconis gallopava TaxID=253628 RepID=A0A0D2AGL1_9PEZI|nr:uncharacterized protein PV09_03582 [Verruconis gallopava]KIW05725.1 hypothetical protein PV09_03582 [Verruconis gallopava]